jgi:3-methylcrotonyl-CoA carboxylase alpha subunit
MRAPMPGLVKLVRAARGEAVRKGQALIVLEAMKMEHTIVAPAPGIVTAVNFAVGDRVAEGADLVDLEDPPATCSC